MTNDALPTFVQDFLTPDEHASAQVTAYHIALTRTDGRRPPPFDQSKANADFLAAAGLLEALRGVPGVLNGPPVLHEVDPLDDLRGRPIPIALRRFPILDNSVGALDEFISLQSGMADWEYWSLLGHIWVFSIKKPMAFDYWYSHKYRELFGSDRPSREQLMTPQERATLNALESPLAVFRGCQKGLNEQGLSWSRDQQVANRFALTYYPFGPRTVLSGTCDPDDAIAYFDYDNEREVIIHSSLVNVTPTQS